MAVQLLPIDSFRRQIQRAEKFTLIDVRTPAEFRRAHVAGAQLLPLDQLTPETIATLRQQTHTQTPLYIICEKGGRAAKACEKLAAAGLTNVFSIEGGTAACQSAGLPLESAPRGAISLERQVRIAAGSLTLLGLALTLLASPWFLLLPAFIGAGLLFAGLTDSCGLALLLAKLPWNHNQPSCPAPTPQGNP